MKKHLLLSMCVATFVSPVIVESKPLQKVVSDAYYKVPSQVKSGALGVALLAAGMTIHSVWSGKQNELKNRIEMLQRQSGYHSNKNIKAKIRNLRVKRAAHIGLQVAGTLLDLAGGYIFLNSAFAR